MKILVLYDRYPLPMQHGQHLRFINLAKHLIKTNTLDLVYFGSEPLPETLGNLSVPKYCFFVEHFVLGIALKSSLNKTTNLIDLCS